MQIISARTAQGVEQTHKARGSESVHFIKCRFTCTMSSAVVCFSIFRAMMLCPKHAKNSSVICKDTAILFIQNNFLGQI